MPLIECPECHEPISEKAHSCPKCGYPLLTSKLKRQIPKVLRHYVFGTQYFAKKSTRFVLSKFAKPILLGGLLIAGLIFLNNYLLLLQAERVGWNACDSARGRTVYVEYGSSQTVAVPEDVKWNRVESVVNQFFDVINFDLDIPYVGSIRVGGYDGEGNIWDCVPSINSASTIFSTRPYRGDGYLWIERKD